MSREVHQSKITIRRATYDDCLTLAPVLRKEDKEEVWAGNRLLPEEALILSFNSCPETYVGILNGEVIGMFGCSPKDDVGFGTPWLLGSDAIKIFSREFLIASKQFFPRVFLNSSFLSNTVWSKNYVHIKWLKWMGFTIDPTEIRSPNNEVFFYFYMHTKEYHNV